jgi:hypothetical protein
MNTFIKFQFKSVLIFGIVLITSLVGCKRDLEELTPAKYPTDPKVFIDGFSANLIYAAFGGSNPKAFQVDKQVTYNNSAASMRFEVPAVNDPAGAYAGGSFFTSVGRNLTGYTALTFWAKASQSANIDIVGIGNDLGANKYQASVAGLAVNTNWKKYYIPIPDPSKFVAERGMFFYSEGAESGNGYTFWIDEVKFEELGTIAHAQPTILLGQKDTINSFAGITTQIGGLSSVFNLPNGVNQTVDLVASYFEFFSSNEEIATVSNTGLVSIIGGPGTAVITAKMNGELAKGSLTVITGEPFQTAPVPTNNPNDVISLFSEAFPNVPVDYYNGYWAPFQTTLSEDFTVGNDNILSYTNFNFVGVQFSDPTIDATTMTNLRVDLFFPNAIAPGTQFKVKLVDFGADGAFDGGDDTNHSITFSSPTINTQNWISLDIPLANFTGLASRAHLGQLIFEGTNITNFYADNIYFRR